MAWMLMTESPSRAPAHIEPRTRQSASGVTDGARTSVDDGPAAPDPQPSVLWAGIRAPATGEPAPHIDRLAENGSGPDREVSASQNVVPLKTGQPPQSRDAWILFGDVERALIQAGILEGLCDFLPPPRYIYASGIAAVNAMLLSQAGSRSLTRRWESLRAAHFLIPAALIRIAAFPLTDVLANDLSEKAIRVLAHNASPKNTTPTVLFADHGLQFPLDGAGQDYDTRWRKTLLRDDNTPASLATTLRAAARSGVERVFVFGLDARLRGHPLVTAVTNGGPAGDMEIAFIGLGGPERLIRDGRSAADAWKKTRS